MRGFFRTITFLGTALAAAVWSTPDVSLWFGALAGAMLGIGAVFGWSDD